MASAFPKRTLNVRMYNVGFGDCFLLSFPVDSDHRHVLVDCGAHAQGNLGNLQEIAQNIRDVTGGRLEAIVATHRHQDHIWGFERGREIFRSMNTINEVWLPWVEDLGNDDARAMWKKHEKARAMLQANLALVAAGPRHSAIESVLLNLKPNQVALDELRSRFGKGPKGVRYLYGGHEDLISAAGIDGLVVKVLGPPKEESFLKKMTAPKAERWSLAMAGADAGFGALPDPLDSPFDPRWADPTHGTYWATEETKVFDRAERALFDESLSDALDLAFALEDAVNNSSLALFFRFGGQGLLMPGDAQWGNWASWIDGTVADGVFESTTLYKAGHHGSHNATPKSIVDRLPKSVTVLVSTHHPEPFPTIPEPKLMAALEARSGRRVVRSDATGDLPEGFMPGDYWIDYQVNIP
jgi:beta-lactamase superfamily II metal-dependent hydrolase